MKIDTPADLYATVTDHFIGHHLNYVMEYILEKCDVVAVQMDKYAKNLTDFWICISVDMIGINLKISYGFVVEVTFDAEVRDVAQPHLDYYCSEFERISPSEWFDKSKKYNIGYTETDKMFVIYFENAALDSKIASVNSKLPYVATLLAAENLTFNEYPRTITLLS